jgi:hypothetical protein
MNNNQNAPEITKQPSYLSTESTRRKSKKKIKNGGKVIHAKDVSYVEQKPQLIRAKQHHSPFILSLNVTPDEQKIQQYFTFPSSQHAHSHIETASFCIQ